MTDLTLKAEILEDFITPSGDTPDFTRASDINLEIDYFLGRIIFRIGDLVLDTRSRRVPVLGFAVTLNLILNELSDRGEMILPSMRNDQDIRLRRIESGGPVIVGPVDAVGEAEISYAELSHAANTLLIGVLNDLESKYPDLGGNEAFKSFKALPVRSP